MKSSTLLNRLRRLGLCPMEFQLDPSTGALVDTDDPAGHAETVAELAAADPILTEAFVGFGEIVFVPMRAGGEGPSNPELPDRLYVLLYPADDAAPKVSRKIAAPKLNDPRNPSTLAWAMWSESESAEDIFFRSVRGRLQRGYSPVVQVNARFIGYAMFLLGDPRNKGAE